MRIEIDTTAATIAELQGITALLAAVLMERGGTLYTPEDMRAREGDFPAPLFVVNGGEQFQNGDPAAAFGGSASNVVPFPTTGATPLQLPMAAPATSDVVVDPSTVFASPAPSMISTTVSPVTIAPAAPSAPSSPTELDINSIPWDDRIHSTTRAKNQDGTWRYRRNLDPQTRDMVMIELRARAGAAPVPAGTPPLPTPPAAAPPPPPPPPVTLPAPGAVPVPTPSPARLPDSSEPNVVPPIGGATPPPPPSGNAPPPPPPAPSASSAMGPATAASTNAPIAAEVVDFNSFIRRVNYACQQLKTHTIAQVQDACKAEGCGNIPDVVNHKDKIPAILARLKL